MTLQQRLLDVWTELNEEGYDNVGEDGEVEEFGFMDEVSDEDEQGFDDEEWNDDEGNTASPQPQVCTC